MPGEFLWGYNEAADEWVAVAVNASGHLQCDVTPGDKVVTRIMNAVAVAAGATSVAGDCTPVDLSAGAISLMFQVSIGFLAGATLGARVHVQTSRDGTNWDTQDYDWWPMPVAAVLPGTVVQTEPMDPWAAHLRLLVENLDPVQPITVSAWSIVGP